MNQLIILLGRIPLVIWFLIAGAWGYMIHSDFYELKWDPMLVKIQQQQALHKKLVKENAESAAFNEQRGEKLRELNELAQEFQKTADKIPRTPEVAGILKSLADISDNAGLTFAKFKPGAQLQEEFLVITPLDVQIKGTYPQVLSFIDAVSNMKRVVSGQELILDSARKRGTSAILNAKAVLYTYHIGDVLLSEKKSEDKEKPKKDEAAKK